jgi:hypothetical protein
MQTYEQIRGHKPDFIVSYRLYSPAEGDRMMTFQHLRCNFMYEGGEPAMDGLFMIHPEFLDAKGHPLDDRSPVPLHGRASMWILVPEMRAKVHRARLKVGTRGHFTEGSRKIGDVTVESLIGLHENSAA